MASPTSIKTKMFRSGETISGLVYSGAANAAAADYDIKLGQGLWHVVFLVDGNGSGAGITMTCGPLNPAGTALNAGGGAVSSYTFANLATSAATATLGADFVGVYTMCHYTNAAFPLIAVYDTLRLTILGTATGNIRVDFIATRVG